MHSLLKHQKVFHCICVFSSLIAVGDMLLTTRNQINDGLILQMKQRSNGQRYPKCWNESYEGAKLAVPLCVTESHST